MLLPNLGPPPEGCVPSICWAEDLSASSQPLSSVGIEDLMQELGLSGCSPESSAVFPPPSLASMGRAEQPLPPAAQWPRSHCRRESARWPAPRGTQRGELLRSLGRSGVSPEMGLLLDISLSFWEWRRNMGMVCLPLLALCGLLQQPCEAEER